VLESFDDWCEKKWAVLCNWAVAPCPVYVSPACIEQAKLAYPASADILFGVCHPIAARHYDELAAKYRAGQVARTLTAPLRGTWHVLLYLGALYLDNREHPVPTRERRLVNDPD
jgi:hypothetical protein